MSNNWVYSVSSQLSMALYINFFLLPVKILHFSEDIIYIIYIIYKIKMADLLSCARGYNNPY